MGLKGAGGAHGAVDLDGEEALQVVERGVLQEVPEPVLALAEGPLSEALGGDAREGEEGRVEVGWENGSVGGPKETGEKNKGFIR